MHPDVIGPAPQDEWMAKPAITVAMSVFNGAAYLEESVASILTQTETDFEFLIVNDGSEDDSGAILEHLAERDSRIRVIHQPNRGLVASLNRLVEESRAPLFARMDADDICLPHRLARQRAFLDQHANYGVVGSWTYDLRPGGAPRQPAAVDPPICHQDFLEAIEQNRPLLCHPSAMMRRDLLRAVGGYRETFKHCEDYDLWLRLTGITQLCSLPERLLIYRYSDSQVSARHIVAQQIGAAAARLAYEQRKVGLPDPIDALTTLPSIASFDVLFAKKGASRRARGWAVSGLLYSARALRGDGFDLILDHVRDGHSSPALWRTVLRLFRLGEVRRSIILAAALAWHGRRP